MAGQDGRQTFDLKRDLLENARSYSFFQAIGLLRLLTGQNQAGMDRTLFEEKVRVRSLLSMSFPGTDIDSIEEESHGDSSRFVITANFLGLYGAASPLPTHYTEDLLDEASDDRTVTRDFLDILGDPFYRLFYQVWSRNRWFVKLFGENDPDYYERLFCLLGLGLPELRQNLPRPRRFLRYIGLFAQFPRSAEGLRSVLSDIVDESFVEVVPNVLRKVEINQEQRCFLGRQGHRLGLDCYLGQEIDDRMGKIRVCLGPLDSAKFESLLPGRPLYWEVVEAVRLFLIEPLECELRLILNKEEARTTTLGDRKWSGLGYNTWVFSGEELTGEAMLSFCLPEQITDGGGDYHDQCRY
jgi:type VI secretion system protein ImpH